MGRDGERSDEELVLGAVDSRLILERGCSVRSIAMTGCTILFLKFWGICFLHDEGGGPRVESAMHRALGTFPHRRVIMESYFTY